MNGPGPIVVAGAGSIGCFVGGHARGGRASRGVPGAAARHRRDHAQRLAADEFRGRRPSPVRIVGDIVGKTPRSCAMRLSCWSA